MNKRYLLDRPIVRQLGANLKYQRERIGLNQTQLGKLISVRPCRISLIEKGHTQPQMEELINLCNVFEVTPNNVIPGFCKGVGVC